MYSMITMNNIIKVQKGNDRPLTTSAESLCEFNWDNKRKQTANDNIGEVRQ